MASVYCKEIEYKIFGTEKKYLGCENPEEKKVIESTGYC